MERPQAAATDKRCGSLGRLLGELHAVQRRVEPALVVFALRDLDHQGDGVPVAGAVENLSAGPSVGGGEPVHDDHADIWKRAIAWSNA